MNPEVSLFHDILDTHYPQFYTFIVPRNVYSISLICWDLSHFMLIQNSVQILERIYSGLFSTCTVLQETRQGQQEQTC